jgi:hypothetical protein
MDNKKRAVGSVRKAIENLAATRQSAGGLRSDRTGKGLMSKLEAANKALKALDQMSPSNQSQLVKYRQNFTVPAVWVPQLGVRVSNIPMIPPQKIEGLDGFVASAVQEAISESNPISLNSGSDFTSKMTIRSSIIDFKQEADIEMFTVPVGYMFSIDYMEILTTSISSPGSPPTVRFGNSSEYAAYYSDSVSNSNDLGARHIIEDPQNAVQGGTTVTFGVTSASTASLHMGSGIVSGHLVKLT